MKEIQKSIRDEEWYQGFIEEITGMWVEIRAKAALELIRGKWELGKRIVEEEESFKRFGYGERIVETISKDLGISVSHLWKIIQFYKQFPFENFEEVFGALPGGQVNPTWYWICQKVLPEHTEEKAEKELREKKQKECLHYDLLIKCRNCGKILKEDEEIEIKFKERKELEKKEN